MSNSGEFMTMNLLCIEMLHRYKVGEHDLCKTIAITKAFCEKNCIKKRIEEMEKDSITLHQIQSGLEHDNDTYLHLNNIILKLKSSLERLKNENKL